MRNPPTAPTGPAGHLLRDSRKDGVQLVRVSGRRWTAEAERIFLQSLLDTCNVTLSARAAGFSPQTVHLRRRRDAGFGSRWDAALEDGMLRLEHALLEGAIAHVEGDLDYDGPIREISMEAAIQLLRIHQRRRAELRYRPAPHERRRTLDEVRASILRKIEMIQRHSKARAEKPWLFNEEVDQEDGSPGS